MPDRASIFSVAAPYLYPFAIAFIVTLIATPVIRRFAIRQDLYDRPDGGLKPHQRPIPYLGGVAMYLGWLASILFLAYHDFSARDTVLWIALAGTILMITGLVDDLRHLRPHTRLAIQALAALLLIHAGIGEHVGHRFVALLEGHVPAALTGTAASFSVSLLFVVFVIAGTTNSTNLIDGLDGLCSGVVAIAAMAFAMLNINLAMMYRFSDLQEPIRAAIAMGVFGATFAFLFYNFNPATIFMGDSGSLLLGFNVALLIILFTDRAGWPWLAAAVVIYAFPALDTALAITRRALNRKPLFIGDRSHIYDQIRDRGFSTRLTALICYDLAIVFGVLGIFLVRLGLKSIAGILIGIPLVALVILRLTGMLKIERKVQP